jgi:hypothetical protein
MDSYSVKDLSSEIAAKIEALREKSMPVLNPDWITNEIMDDHREDMQFLHCTSRATVREEIRRYLNKFKLAPMLEADRQIVLPGFERVQEYYLCDRGAVHIDSMTDEELEGKAIELETMAEGCKEHAWEIRRYIVYRRSKVKRSA